MTIYRLQMTANATTAPQQFILAPGDIIDTDRMSECTSVIILYDYDGIRYRRAVAQHGGGGIGHVNLAAMMAIPPLAARVLMPVFICSGANTRDEPPTAMNGRHISSARTALRAAGFTNIRNCLSISGVRVSDTGHAALY